MIRDPLKRKNLRNLETFGFSPQFQIVQFSKLLYPIIIMIEYLSTCQYGIWKQSSIGELVQCHNQNVTEAILNSRRVTVKNSSG